MPGKMVISAQVVDARIGVRVRPSQGSTLATSCAWFRSSWGSSGPRFPLESKIGMICWQVRSSSEKSS